MGIQKRDRGYTRTSQDIERKYNFRKSDEAIEKIGDAEKVIVKLQDNDKRLIEICNFLDDRTGQNESDILVLQNGLSRLENDVDVLEMSLNECVKNSEIEGFREQILQNTSDIDSIKSGAISEVLDKLERELEIKLADYPTSVEVETLIERRAGEIETTLSAGIEVKLEDYTKTVDMRQYVKETVSEYERVVSETYATKNSLDELDDKIESNSASITANARAIELKLDSSSFTGSAVIGLINNGDGSSTTKIRSDMVDIEGVVKFSDLSNYITEDEASSIYATQDSLSDYMTESEANNKYLTSEDLSGYASSADIAKDYLSIASASSTYATKDSLSDYLTTSSAAATYATLSSLSSYATTAALKNGTTTVNGACITTGVIAAKYLALDDCVMMSDNKVKQLLNLSGGLQVNCSDTANGIELNGATPYIDFHYNNSSEDFTHRIIAERIYNYSSNTNYLGLHFSCQGITVGDSNYIQLWSNSAHSKAYLVGCGQFEVVNYQNFATYLPVLAQDFVKSSSRRYKENVELMTDEEAEKILDIEVVTFDYKNRDNGTDCRGVIAEDVYKIIPSVVTLADIDGEMVPEAVSYGSFVPYLIKEVQVLKKELMDVKGERSVIKNE